MKWTIAALIFNYSLSVVLCQTGIDVSKYQGDINWRQVKSNNGHMVDFAYIKSSQGTTIQDSYYKHNMQEARRAGILVGSYHFFSEGGSGIEQADYFIETISGVEQDLIPVVDVERVPPYGVMGLKRNLRDFINRMKERYGIHPMLYTGVFFYNLNLAGSFDDIPLWLAHYGDIDDPTPIDGRQWTIWQYSSKGSVAGIRGDVDMDRLHSKASINDISMNAPVQLLLRPLDNVTPRPNAIPQDMHQ